MAYEHELEIISKGVEEIVPQAELEQKLAKSAKTGKPLRIKYGIDPTGYDIHIGHLVPIRKMREFQDLGHTGVIIIGDFTARIGDPTGRDESRPPLTETQIRFNCDKYMEQLFTILKPEQTEVRYQSEWFGKMMLDDVLKILGKFTLAQFMAHDTFRNRYEQGLSLGMHELMYPVLQAWDSVAVESDVELGATEQKFNILAGRDMQRYYGMEQQVAVLSPILLGTDGVNKMGKSMNNYIAVFDTPADKYGKVMSIPDTLILNYYNYATKYSLEQIKEVEQKLAAGTNPMLLKKRLAYEIVALYHTEAEAAAAQEGFEKLFSKGELPEDIPEYEISQSPIRISTLLVQSGLCNSNGEAKRLIQGGGVSIDGEKISDFELEMDLKSGMVLRAGKRRFIKIKRV